MTKTNGAPGLYALLPRFENLEVEQACRAFFLPQDKLLARIIFGGSIVIALISMIPDSLTEVDASRIKGLHLASVGFIICSLILFGISFVIRHYRQYDIITTTWWCGVVATVTFGNTLYPPDVIIHAVFDILIPVAIYLLIPIGLISQVLLAALFTGANLGILFLLKTGLSDVEISFVLVSYVTVHFLGIISCWQLHLGRRKQFLEHRAEQTTRKQLEESLNELNVLRGIIPICAYCKQIRDDEGYWHQVEAYISRHSGANFTHGICPECIKEHFPREYARIVSDEKIRNSKDTHD